MLPHNRRHANKFQNLFFCFELLEKISFSIRANVTMNVQEKLYIYMNQK